MNYYNGDATINTTSSNRQRLTREEVFFNHVSERYGSYVAYVMIYAFSSAVYAFALFVGLFVSMEYARYRDIEADISHYSTAVFQSVSKNYDKLK